MKRHHQGKKKSLDTTAKQSLAYSGVGTGVSSHNKSRAAKNVIVPNALTPIRLAWNIEKKKKQIVPRSIVVHQSPDDDTWPGGAVWDLGWSLAQVIIAMSISSLFPDSSRCCKTQNAPNDTITTTTTMNVIENNAVTQEQYHISNTMELPSRVKNALQMEPVFRHSPHEQCIVLELGCGVGLTGLVCALAFSEHISTTVILTDLSIVVERITLPNVHRNAKSMMKTTYLCRTPDDSNKNDSSADEMAVGSTIITQLSHDQVRSLQINTISQHGRVISMPLCWGDCHDMRNVQSVIHHLRTTNTRSHLSSEKSPRNRKSMCALSSSDISSRPDFLLIGDVAYQHQPGAPSHFDALVETILEFMAPNTILIFGLRVRMAASMDLFLQLLEHFEEIVSDPILPQEVNAVLFQNVKPNTMTIHFLKQRSRFNEATSTTLSTLINP